MPVRHVRRFAASLLFVTMFSVIPASAAPRGDDADSHVPRIEKVVKVISNLVARVLDGLTLPKP